MISIRQGEALDVLRELESASCHALVTDPPAGIGFMGRTWDRDRGGRDKWVAWLAEILREARRVLKPGAHALVWALPKTAHWTALALEDAGFEIRDVVVHLYGQGMPKTRDVSKALDDLAGAKRTEVVREGVPAGTAPDGTTYGKGLNRNYKPAELRAPVTDEAKQWQGWGTGLKPAAEHWILARVPFRGSVERNVLEHGTGALNIDASRIECEGGSPAAAMRADAARAGRIPGTARTNGEANELGKLRNRTSLETFAAPRPGEELGRWPANLVLDEDAARALDDQSGELGARGNRGPSVGRSSGEFTFGATMPRRCGAEYNYDAGGGASRFFWTPKASTTEKGEGNVHPTVKPLALMRYLIRMITPPGGTVLDPFAGSGTTVLAALLETSFNCIGIEREGEYASIALARAREIDPLFHDVPAPGAASGT
jgi:hypothetical protein